MRGILLGLAAIIVLATTPVLAARAVAPDCPDDLLIQPPRLTIEEELRIPLIGSRNWVPFLFCNFSDINREGQRKILGTKFLGLRFY
jgi:hypothetical protein